MAGGLTDRESARAHGVPFHEPVGFDKEWRNSFLLCQNWCWLGIFQLLCAFFIRKKMNVLHGTSLQVTGLLQESAVRAGDHVGVDSHLRFFCVF